MGRQATTVLYVLTMVVVVVGVDVLFFRNHFWERLMANVGIVLRDRARRPSHDRLHGRSGLQPAARSRMGIDSIMVISLYAISIFGLVALAGGGS